MLLRKALPFTSAALLAAMIYTGWTFYSRWAEARRADTEETARRRELDRQTLNMIGTDLKILTFYSSPQTIQAGQQALICYGVANAKTVRISPAVETLMPSLGRCIQASPVMTTEYTLTAQDDAGHRVSQTIAVKVR